MDYKHTIRTTATRIAQRWKNYEAKPTQHLEAQAEQEPPLGESVLCSLGMGQGIPQVPDKRIHRRRNGNGILLDNGHTPNIGVLKHGRRHKEKPLDMQQVPSSQGNEAQDTRPEVLREDNVVQGMQMTNNSKPMHLRFNSGGKVVEFGKEERQAANPVKRLSKDSGSILTTASQTPPAPSTPIVANSYITVEGKLDDIISLAESATTRAKRGEPVEKGDFVSETNRAKPTLMVSESNDEGILMYYAEDVERERAEQKKDCDDVELYIKDIERSCLENEKHAEAAAAKNKVLVAKANALEKKLVEMDKGYMKYAEQHGKEKMELREKAEARVKEQAEKYEAMLSGCNKTIKELMAERNRLEAENEQLKEHGQW
jgi:hypothetical protein